MKEIILTPAAEHLDIDGLTLEEHPKDAKREFPDGEVYIQLPEIEKLEESVVIHSGMPEPNKGLMYLYGILELLKKNNVETEVVFTYFPYGMQDKEFFEGNLNYADSIIEKLTEYYKVEKIHLVEPHFKNREWIENYPINLLAVNELLKERIDKERKLIGPDIGAGERLGIDSFEKKRENSEKVNVEGEISSKGREVTVADDLVETGGTLSETCGKLRSQGFEQVDAAVVHGVLNEGVEKAKEKFDNFYTTNSIGNTYSNIDIEPLIRESIL
jgi:ribose-phosphate pyrophosphokinase